MLVGPGGPWGCGEADHHGEPGVAPPSGRATSERVAGAGGEVVPSVAATEATVGDAGVVVVIVPVRDGAATMPGLLDALAAQTVAHRVVVVDNGSTDATADVAREHHSGPQVVHESTPGSYAARNRGLRERGDAEVVAFTDADCRPAPDWLERAVAHLRADADLVGGRVVHDATASPTVWERYDRGIYLDQQVNVESDGFAATANVVTRREVVDAIGPFDGTLRSSGDREWTERAVAAGFRLVYAHDAVVTHRPRTTAGEVWRLYRRLGAGWRDLARQGKRPPFWRDPDLWVPFRWVHHRVKDSGGRVSPWVLGPVHLFAMTARLLGRVTGR